MSNQTKLGEIASILKTVGDFFETDPDAKDFRIKRKMKRKLRKSLKKADDQLDDLKEMLTNDSDGFTEQDKQMMKDAESSIAQNQLLLIKMGIY